MWIPSGAPGQIRTDTAQGLKLVTPAVGLRARNGGMAGEAGLEPTVLVLETSALAAKLHSHIGATGGT
jgi:hypothetical protein